MDPTDVSVFQFRQRLLETIEQKVTSEPEDIPDLLREMKLPPGDASITELYFLRLLQIELEKPSQKWYAEGPFEMASMYALSDVVSISAGSIALFGVVPAWITTSLAAYAAGWLFVGGIMNYWLKKEKSHFHQQRQEARSDALLQFYGKPPGEMVH